jgi:hypothetical protein
MKKIFGLITSGAALIVLSVSVFANTTSTVVNETLQDPAADACSSDAKIALYAIVTANLQTDQAKVYDAAKKYVACPSEGADEAEMKRVTYLKTFIGKYEKAHRKDQLLEQIGKKNYPVAFETGKQVFADDPAYLRGYMELALAGALSGNQALSADTIAYAKKAMELIEGGANPEKDKWTPFESKEDALAKLNYAVGSLSAAATPDAAIPFLIKAASYNSKIKSTALTYVFLAESYEHGPYAKQFAEYQAKYKDKDETPESKLALENINQIIDREIDAYARAVALGAADPGKAEWMKALTDLYKFRNKSEAGLDTMIAGILQKPLPPVPTPITSLPTPASTPAGTSNGAATPAAGNGNGTAATPPMGGTQPKPMTPTTTKPAATPATTTSKTAPGRPKTRRAHSPGN